MKRWFPDKDKKIKGTQKLNQEDERIADDKNVAYELREQSRKNKWEKATD